MTPALVTVDSAKERLWLRGVTVVAIALAVVPGMPAIIPVLLPGAVLSIRDLIMDRRRRQGVP